MKIKEGNVPIDRVVMEEEDAGEFTSGIEISPINSRPTVTRIEYEGRERRV